MSVLTNGSIQLDTQKGLSSTKKSIWRRLWQDRGLVVMSVPLLIYIIIFRYIPIWGWIMAFQRYRPGTSFFNQEWVGLQNFQMLFTDARFYQVMRNTLAMSFINLILGFVTAITLALMLNEVRNLRFKKSVQTISYIPHFISWVIAANIIRGILTPDSGMLNTILMQLRIIDAPIFWLGRTQYFWGIIGISNVWKSVGWNSIIYLAAMSGIDPQLYESADIDGANRFQRIFHITLPSIRPTIVILLIMSIGHIMNAGFEQQWFLGNSMVIDYSEVFDIYVLRYGIQLRRYSFGTAAGIFKSVVSVAMLLFANVIAKRFDQERIM